VGSYKCDKMFSNKPTWESGFVSKIFLMRQAKKSHWGRTFGFPVSVAACGGAGRGPVHMLPSIHSTHRWSSAWVTTTGHPHCISSLHLNHWLPRKEVGKYASFPFPQEVKHPPCDGSCSEWMSAQGLVYITQMGAVYHDFDGTWVAW